MGRPPCCEKAGVKKGPWTPEEDIMLVSYLQEHGPGNWRAVPTNTGLRRCSKSCRLRWTNYLRPGIKRGSFTNHEEKMIIQLQDLLGNKWAAIASYLPERTDNDIKNFWNTHLKKKLNNSDSNDYLSSKSVSLEKTSCPSVVPEDTVQTVFYASSTENIARLLQSWTKNSKPKSKIDSRSSSSTTQQPYNHKNRADSTIDQSKSCGLDLSEAYENLFGFESFDSSSSEFSPCASTTSSIFHGEGRRCNNADVTNLSMVENWLLEDNGKDDLRTSFSSPSFF